MVPPASTILLVEDDRSLRGSLGQFFNDHGYRTLQAETARQGWELAHARRPQLCLLDLNLPDGSGLDLLKKLTDAHLQTRVIVMTAFDLHHARPTDGGLLAGWLIKPVNPLELLKLVENVLGPHLTPSDGGTAST
ncbi:MAG TPA: response regulator [Tepidisphaeraceae bacterium]|jgi:two-component system OmpR family response regulator|nr:response regulator [Tepidisphaeraceae bacterium]